MSDDDLMDTKRDILDGFVKMTLLISKIQRKFRKEEMIGVKLSDGKHLAQSELYIFEELLLKLGTFLNIDKMIEEIEKKENEAHV